MTQNLLTNTENTEELTKKLEVARERERKARARVSKLKREMNAMDRKRAAQQKITIGAALLRAAEALSASQVEQLKKLIRPHITRKTDIECLRGTLFEILEETGGDNGTG
ncbi:hypothetical protein [Fodinicurvata sediminis]|uniref:hypothetical protein n=1 Tax=Fodinicurvata sediminis TaxID=1121832 RepID=UPI0003B5A5B6|nr:hypothetical protein [Fodinicurvata sediminis]